MAASRRQPSTTAFAAPSFDASAESVPTSWKPDQTAGSTTCRAIAAVAKRDDLRDHHRPAREPPDDGAAEAAGPLVDRAGQRDSARPARRSTARPSAARRARPARSRRTPYRRSRSPARTAGRRWSGWTRTRSRPRTTRSCRPGARVAGRSRTGPGRRRLVPWWWVRSVLRLTFRPPSSRPGTHTAARGLQGLPGFCPAVERRRRDSAASPLGPGLPSAGSGTLGAPRRCGGSFSVQGALVSAASSCVTTT